MNKSVKNVIGWIVYIAILVGLIYGIPKGLVFLLKTDYPMASITSGSMWPALKKGDLILIKGVFGKEDIKIGDIIVFKNQKGLTIHRVVEIKEDTVLTKGDANNVADSPVTYEEIIGKALSLNNKAFRIPLLGMVGFFVNKAKI